MYISHIYNLSALERHGYVSGDSLVAAPYDFRMATRNMQFYYTVSECWLRNRSVSGGR